MERKHSSLTGRAWSIVVFATLAVSMFALTGCFQSSTEVSDVQTSASGDAVPTMQQIRAGVTMSEEQAQALQPAHGRWSRAEIAASANDAAPLVDPALEFFGESADVLDRPQLNSLVGVVLDHQARRADGDPPRLGRRHGRRDGRGPRHGGPGDGAGFLSDLDLSDEQKEALREARQRMGAAMRELRQQVKSGDLSREAFREAANAVRAEFHAAVQEILEPDQLALLEKKQRERMIAHLEKRIAHHARASARKLEVLTRILRLDENQVTAIGAIHDKAGSGMEEVLAQLKDESMTPKEARLALRDLRRSTHEAIVAELDDEQAALFRRLLSLRRGGRHHP